MRDYTGKTVFVGIDVHKKTYAVACICDGIVVKRDTLQAYPSILLEYLDKYFAGAKLKTVYEAGFSGFVLHRFLLEHQIDSIIIHAASVEISARDRVKTDKRDALKLATQLSDGRLRCIHVPTLEREGYREISRLRERLTRDRKRVGNRLKSLLHRHGLLSAETAPRITQIWMKSVLNYECSADIKYVIQQCVEHWFSLVKQLLAVQKELAKQAVLDEALEKVYRSAPGIGPISARVLANELGDMSQFSNEKKLFSFTGMTPSEHSSGEHKRQGNISRQGRSIIRKTLVEVAWIAIRRDESLRLIFDRIAKKAGAKRAIVAIARRLIGQIRSCFNKGVLYEYRKVERQYETVKQDENKELKLEEVN